MLRLDGHSGTRSCGLLRTGRVGSFIPGQRLHIGAMLKLTPILLAVLYAFLMMRFSVWQTKRTLDAQSRPLDDPEIGALAARMATALDVPEIRVNVYDIDAVNGLAAPDGRIFLTRGFLAKKARGEVSAEELASVIAHELGHVAMGHMRRRMIDFTGQNAVFVMLSAILSRFVPVIGVWIARLISTALMAGLSRRDEFEADAYASALLIKSGIGTGPQKALFGKLAALTGNAGQGVPAWMLSHPRADERIAAITANEDRWRQVA
jgi:metalloprotease